MSKSDDMRALIDLANGNSKIAKENKSKIKENKASAFKNFREWALNEQFGVEVPTEIVIHLVSPEGGSDCGCPCDEMSCTDDVETVTCPECLQGCDKFGDSEVEENNLDRMYAQHMMGESEQMMGHDQGDREFSHHYAGHDDYKAQVDMFRPTAKQKTQSPSSMGMSTDFDGKLDEENIDEGVESDMAQGAAHWASYLVNGDDSGLTPEEIKACDAWQKKLEPWYVVSVSDEEPYFSWSFGDITGLPARGGDLVDYIVHKHEDAPKEVAEDYGDHEDTSEAAKNAIMRRIMLRHPDLLKKYGLEKVEAAAEDESMHLNHLEEIGSSDVSCWVNNIMKRLNDAPTDVVEDHDDTDRAFRPIRADLKKTLSDLEHAVTRYDRAQENKKYYNHYALAHYMKACDHVIEEMQKGKSLKDAIETCFLDSLRRYVLKFMAKAGYTDLQEDMDVTGIVDGVNFGM